MSLCLECGRSPLTEDDYCEGCGFEEASCTCRPLISGTFEVYLMGSTTKEERERWSREYPENWTDAFDRVLADLSQAEKVMQAVTMQLRSRHPERVERALRTLAEYGVQEAKDYVDRLAILAPTRPEKP